MYQLIKKVILALKANKEELDLSLIDSVSPDTKTKINAAHQNIEYAVEDLINEALHYYHDKTKD